MDRLKIVFFTNSTSQFSSAVLKALVDDDRFAVSHIIFFDTVAASRGRLLSVIKQHGLRKTTGKVIGLVANKVRTKLLGNRTAQDEIRYTRQLADAEIIPYSIVKSANDTEIVKLVREQDADLLLASSFNQILKAPMLETARAEAINIHMSLLPKYRGPAPAFWALFHDDDETGVTFHRMNVDIDEGDAIAQRSLPIEDDWDEEGLTKALFELAGRHVADVLAEVASGLANASHQDEDAASYFTFPTAAQRRELDVKLAQCRTSE
jgi:methionyl-tRNA formyltransferase